MTGHDPRPNAVQLRGIARRLFTDLVRAEQAGREEYPHDPDLAARCELGYLRHAVTLAATQLWTGEDLVSPSDTKAAAVEALTDSHLGAAAGGAR